SHYGPQHRSRHGWVGCVAQSGRGKVVGTPSKALPAEQPDPGPGRAPGRAQRAGGRRRYRRVPKPRRRRVLGACGRRRRPVNGLHDLDVHDLALARTSPPRAYVATNGELFWSDDRGEKWTPIGVKTRWPLPYARGIAVKPDDPRVLFAGCGETTTGETGGVLRSSDGGQTWRSLPLPVQPNATMWGLATHPADA